MSGKTIIDRREFLAAAGAAAAVACLPLAGAAPAVGASTPRELLTDWHIDDMWGVYPRPSEAIGFAPPRDEPERVAAHHPVDAAYLA
jgi:hypothetical protein